MIEPLWAPASGGGANATWHEECMRATAHCSHKIALDMSEAQEGVPEGEYPCSRCRVMSKNILARRRR